jgi:hypothetical protein
MVQSNVQPTPITATEQDPKLLLPTIQAYYPNYSPISSARALTDLRTKALAFTLPELVQQNIINYVDWAA